MAEDDEEQNPELGPWIGPEDPTQCTVCLCTQDDPCPGGCAWVAGANLCTACVELAETIAERLERLPPGALERESVTAGVGGLASLVQLCHLNQHRDTFERWAEDGGAFFIRRHGIAGTTIKLTTSGAPRELRPVSFELRGPRNAMLEDLRIGPAAGPMRSQLVSATPIPLAVFTDPPDIETRLDVVHEGESVEIVIALADVGGACSASFQLLGTSAVWDFGKLGPR